MAHTVSMLNLSKQVAALQPGLDQAIARVLESGHFILGPQVSQLEGDIARYLQVPHAIGVASGSDALYLALKAAGIGPGDEVITTAFSYIATSESIARAGARPVFAEIQADTFNIDVDDVKNRLTPNTKAILPVHLYGQAVEMEALMALARANNLLVIEDCAQAIGATDNGRAVGSFGDFGCFSFFPTKNLGAFGDGGLVTCLDEAMARRVKMLRVHGSETKYNHTLAGGVNSRLDELQAAILNVKLPHLNSWSDARRAIAQRYTEAFAGLEGITTPTSRPGADHVFHQYTLRIANGQRDALQTLLRDGFGVTSMVYYPIPLHLQGMHQNLGYQPGELPITERVANEVLSLPIYPEMDDAEINQVIDAVTTASHQLNRQPVAAGA